MGDRQLLRQGVGSSGSQGRQAEDDRRRLYRAVEQSSSLVMITDIQGCIVYVNPKFTQITGYTAAEVQGQTARLLKSGVHDDSFYRGMWATIWAGEEWRGEFCNQKKNGELYWELASISAVRNAAGEITDFVKVGEDITQRKEAEEALRRYAAELKARNEELDAFAHTVAHDLKNPLGLVAGYTEFLESHYKELPVEKLQELLKAIGQSARKMSNIVDELLLLSEVHKLEMRLERVHMGPVVAEALSRLSDLIEKHQAEIILPGSWPAARGHSPWIEEVWANYLSNALKYGGRPPRIELGAREEADGMVRFWIQDNGAGLSAKERARLFVPFTQLRQVRAQGHGLGLSIVRRIVEKLGGQVGVESAGPPQQGSVFYFTLPADGSARELSEGQPEDLEDQI